MQRTQQRAGKVRKRRGPRREIRKRKEQKIGMRDARKLRRSNANWGGEQRRPEREISRARNNYVTPRSESRHGFSFTSLFHMVLLHLPSTATYLRQPYIHPIPINIAMLSLTQHEAPMAQTHEAFSCVRRRYECLHDTGYPILYLSACAQPVSDDGLYARLCLPITCSMVALTITVPYLLTPLRANRACTPREQSVQTFTCDLMQRAPLLFSLCHTPHSSSAPLPRHPSTRNNPNSAVNQPQAVYLCHYSSTARTDPFFRPRL